MSDDLAPVLIGVGQAVQRAPDPRRALGPVALMAEAVSRAADDARLTAAQLSAADRVNVVRSNSSADDLARALADDLALAAAQAAYSTGGGYSPQTLVNAAAERIARSESRLELIAGVETMDSLTRAAKAGIELPHRYVRPEAAGTTTRENAHGLYSPITAYPLFENALAHRRGVKAAEHRTALGALMAPFTQVAAANPYAWFPTARTAEEIATPTTSNRYVGYPYTKYMNAVGNVDQAAALLLTSAGEARRLGVPEDRLVYLHGCAEAHDHWFMSERVAFDRSPAIEVVGRETLAMAGRTIDEVALFDLYSCFPSIVQIAAEALAVPAGRPLTVTGGLPYFGGPGNNYVTHSIAAMAERLRATPGALGLVTANGYYATKHAAGLYSTTPPSRPFVRRPPAEYQAALDALPRPRVEEAPEGRATIETWTVMHGRDGAPEKAVVMGRLEDGARFVALGPDSREALEGLVGDGVIGRTGRVATGQDVSIFFPD